MFSLSWGRLYLLFVGSCHVARELPSPKRTILLVPLFVSLKTIQHVFDYSRGSRLNWSLLHVQQSLQVFNRLLIHRDNDDDEAHV